MPFLLVRDGQDYKKQNETVLFSIGNYLNIMQFQSLLSEQGASTDPSFK